MSDTSTQGRDGAPGGPGRGSGAEQVLPPAEQRLVRLMDEFRRRQRERPDLVVRPWWTPAGPNETGSTIGFVLEYCPGGDASAELRVRADRVTVEGPAGLREAELSLGAGWLIEGRDATCAETLANLILRLAAETFLAA